MISRVTSAVVIAGSLLASAVPTSAALAQTASLKWEARQPGGMW